MIPLRIELENFLSYRQRTVLDFHGIHLACIAGPNGSGKSSILDAITWVIFGRSRARSSDNVVNKTAAALAETAEVNLVFELEGVIYQIVRRKRARKSMQLDLSVADANGAWKSMTEGKLRETQAAIELLLKMNHETFTNASFFLQNKANTFTTNTAAHRKEILADLLGLDIWDSYKAAVNANRREEQNRLSLIDARLEDINLELADEPERISRLSSAGDELKAITGQLNTQENLVDERRKIEEAAELLRQQIESLDDTIYSFQRSLKDLESKKEERALERVKYQELIDDAEAIQASHEAWSDASGEVQKWQKKNEEYSAILERQRPFEIEIKENKARLLQRLDELDRKAKQIADLEKEGKALTIDLSKVKEESDELNKKLAELGDIENQWKLEDSKLRKLATARASIEKEVDILKVESDQVAQLESETAIVKSELTQASSSIEQAKLKLISIEELQTSIAAIGSEKDSKLSEQSRLRDEMDEIQSALQTLSASNSEVCPVCGQALTEQHRQKVIGNLERDGKKMGDRYRENKEIISVNEEKIRQISPEINKKKEIDEVLSQFQSTAASAQSRLEQIASSFDRWHSDGSNRLNELEKNLENDNYGDLVSTVSQLEDDLSKKNELAAAQVEINEDMLLKERRLTNIDEMVADWHGDDGAANPSQEHDQLKERLQKGEFAQEARAEMAATNLEAEKIGYNNELHNSAVHKMEDLSEAPERFQSLSTAEEVVKHLDEGLADISGQIKSTNEKLSELSEKMVKTELSLRPLLEDKVELVAMESELQVMRASQISAHRKVAAAQQNVDVLEKLKVKKEQEWESREEKALLLQRLTMLEKAVGRSGVPSLLIERALPEIESDANLLLDRLTEGEMQVRFETQRKLKSADRSIETLDIHISDSAGTRPYENYSGGEQFRVNFAIRLALSKILTRRAGARLQTLVIDEGFGSQDPLGRQRLIEAINSIHNDYERILIITHIDELRDAFPTQIRVTKGASGSSVTVI